jgi:M-phase inducer tyrosine phosphatase
MFEHPAEVLQHQTAEQTLECPLQSVMDVDEGPQLQLPHFFPEEDTIPRITKETIVEILEGKYSANYDQSLIIDCRFEYEYSGGHIDGAINFNDKEELATKLFSDPSPRKTLLIFHCEYSAHRAPIA